MLLIEGVGGVMVPLDDEHTVLDWMSALGAAAPAGRPGTYLGTISHTLTALDVLDAQAQGESTRRERDRGSSVTLADTIATLERFVPASDRGPDRAPDAAAFQTIAELL